MIANALRRHLLGAALASLVVGCGSIAVITEPVTCAYGGKTYQAGQSFAATDGCNTCSCGHDGTVACTAMACVTPCTYGGKQYAPGQTFPDLDGCNTCTCLQDGAVACTDKACPVCSYAGKTYKPGDTFPALDGCNECTCGHDGSVGCTKKACACDPAKEWWRKYVGSSPSQCAVIDFVCPANTSYFANDCGCGCEQSASCPEWFDCMPPAPCDPAAIKLQCPYSGIAY